MLHLLVYSILYAGLARLFPILAKFEERPSPRVAAILGLVVAIWIIGGLARSIYPQDTWVNVLGVPAEPAHVPQYVLMFAAGTVAGTSWLVWLPSQRATGSLWLGVGLAGSVLWYALRYLDSYGGVDVTSVLPMGVLFPLWEALVCVGLSVGIAGSMPGSIGIIRCRWLSHLGGAAYGVFLIHIFVVVGLNYAFFAGRLCRRLLKFRHGDGDRVARSASPSVVALRKIPGVSLVSSDARCTGRSRMKVCR